MFTQIRNQLCIELLDLGRHFRIKLRAPATDVRVLDADIVGEPLHHLRIDADVKEFTYLNHRLLALVLHQVQHVDGEYPPGSASFDRLMHSPAAPVPLAQ